MYLCYPSHCFLKKSVYFHETMLFSHIIWRLLFLLKESVGYKLKTLSLIANRISANRYNPHTQNLLESSVIFKSINTSWDWMFIVTPSLPDLASVA